MADLSSVTENYFPVAHESFTDTLSSTILAGATTVPITNLSEYDDGDVVVLTVEPGTANEATCIGVKASSPYRLTDVIWTEGNTAVGHNSGSTIIDYDSATHYNLITKFLRTVANQDGTWKAQPIRDALGLAATAVNGWEVSSYTFSVTSGYNKGQKEFDLTVANADVRSVLSVGMKLRLQRGTTAPTQCVDLESSSSQYASRASGSLSGSITSMTDDITVEAWVKPESIVAGNTYGIVSRYNGTSGWLMEVAGDGRIYLIGRNGGASNQSYTATYQSIEVGKWQHIAGCLDMSTFTAAGSPIYINGVSVPVTVTRGGTNPTAFVQAGNLEIGSGNGTNFFDGKIADVRVWNTIRTGTQIRDNMNQQLVGTETNLVGYWKLNGNFNDSTSSANNLTGNGGAVATDTDNPMKDTEYAVITKIAYSAPNSTVTVFTGTDHNIPNMTISAPYYSTQRAPYGFPANKGKWRARAYYNTVISGSGSLNTWGGNGAAMLSLPTGEWDVQYQVPQYSDLASGSNQQRFQYLTLSTSNNSESDPYWTTTTNLQVAASNPIYGSMRFRSGQITVSSQTPYYIVFKEAGTTGISNNNIFASASSTAASGFIEAECPYV